MRLEVKKYLYDIEETAELIVRFTADKTFADYQQNPMLRLAVERALTIIGEALSQLAKFDPTTAARFSEYQRIISFRNVLIHAYAEIDDRIVWDVIGQKLPALRQQAAGMMKEVSESSH